MQTFKNQADNEPADNNKLDFRHIILLQAPVDKMVPEVFIFRATRPYSPAPGGEKRPNRKIFGSKVILNNVTFGDGTFGYDETLAGGAGAGPDFHGASAVHTHMTNTRITDPEVLGTRYPVRLDRFDIRRGSGGKDLFNGGEGVIRQYLFLRPVDVSLLTQRRVLAPFGMEGGEAGMKGRNIRVLPDGDPADLPGGLAYGAAAGESLIIEMPGGGGWGAPARTGLSPAALSP